MANKSNKLPENMHGLFKASDFDIVEFGIYCHERLRVRPMYFELGFSPVSRVFGRRGVFERTIAALDMIPQEYGIEIWDVYRPREVQRKLYKWMFCKIRELQPNLTEKESWFEAEKYASSPSEISGKYCPPHLSGGAIDLTLYDRKTNQELDMGTIFDDCTPISHSEYFEKKTDLAVEEIKIRDNRRFLRYAMKSVGFTTYKYEWWHYDLGNMFWEKATGMKAVFGPLFNDMEFPLEYISDIGNS